MGGEYGYLPRMTQGGGRGNSSSGGRSTSSNTHMTSFQAPSPPTQLNATTTHKKEDTVPETGSVFWFSIPLREVTSSLDHAIGIALGLDDDDDREVVVGTSSDTTTDSIRLSQSRRLF
jgi:hypothetical protein